MPRKISEERMCNEHAHKEMNVPLFVGGIDPQLESAGWYLRDHSKVKTEIPVDGYDAEPWNGVSDYTLYRENGEVLAQKIKIHNTLLTYNADQTKFLRAVQSVFLQKRHLETADLYEPPLDSFGVDAVERWFTEKEVEEVVEFINRMKVTTPS